MPFLLELDFAEAFAQTASVDAEGSTCAKLSSFGHLRQLLKSLGISTVVSILIRLPPKDMDVVRHCASAKVILFGFDESSHP